MLDVRVERLSEKVVVHCAGRICAGENLSRLRTVVLCQRGARAIILDLAHVTAIDAGGLGTLVFLHTSAQRLGRELKLRALSAEVENVFALTGLDAVLTNMSCNGNGGALSLPETATAVRRAG